MNVNGKNKQLLYGLKQRRVEWFILGMPVLIAPPSHFCGVVVGQPNPDVGKDQLSLIFNSWLLYEMLHIFVDWEFAGQNGMFRGTISLVTAEAEAPIGLVRRIGAAK